MDLAGLGVAVTGAGGDLGGAMALELARRGAHVTMLDRVAEAEATERIAAVGAAGSCAYRQVDVTDRAGVDEALAAVEPLDVAIGNAGIVEAAPFLEVSQAQWQTHLDVNVTGCFNVGQAAARLMSSGERAARSSSRAPGSARSRGPRSRPTRSRRRASGCSRARWPGSSQAAGSG